MSKHIILGCMLLSALFFSLGMFFAFDFGETLKDVDWAWIFQDAKTNFIAVVLAMLLLNEME